MVDGSQLLMTMIEVSQPSARVNAKGRPGLSVSGTVPPQGYLGCPRLHYEFSCCDSLWLFIETSEGFQFFSAECSNDYCDLSDEEELCETLSFPPRGEPGKEGRIASTWLQGVRRPNPELNRRTPNIRVGVFSLHFVVDEYKGKVESFIFFTLTYTTDSVL